MKKSLSSLLFSAISSFLFAQGTIVSLTVVPEYPTINDNIEIHAELMFSSSDCLLDNQSHSVNGFNIGASAHHCMGVLTAICNATDVFEVGQLPVGTYTFDLLLTSGYGQSGCSPGFVPDDNDQLSFTVSGSVGIDDLLNSDKLFFPTPTENVLNFSQALSETYLLINAAGQQVMSVPKGTKQIDVSELESGLYLLIGSEFRHRVIKL